MSKKTALLIEFIFKYFDLCLILLYRKNYTKFFNYMINKNNNLFKYYKQYKILTMEKNNNKNDYKETIAFNYYLIEKQISNINKKKEECYNLIFEMIANLFNEFQFKNKSDLYDIEFKKEQNINNDNEQIYNKIAIFCFDEKTKKYYFQDIIDLNMLSGYDNAYKLKVNKNIYLVPLKNINTKLYSIKNMKYLWEIENKKDLNQIIKYENILGISVMMEINIYYYQKKIIILIIFLKKKILLMNLKQI